MKPEAVVQSEIPSAHEQWASLKHASFCCCRHLWVSLRVVLRLRLCLAFRPHRHEIWLLDGGLEAVPLPALGVHRPGGLQQLIV